jgi:hypothetical protein
MPDNDFHLEDVTPARAYRETGRWIGPALFAGLAIILVGTILTVVGWRIGWWFTAQNTTRSAENIQNGYSNQATLRMQVTSKLGDVTSVTVQLASAPAGQVPALKAQRAAIAAIACGDAAQITGTPLPADQASWVTANCLAGSLSPSSSLYVTGAQ